jgi:threonyl-tRNA synthetase
MSTHQDIGTQQDLFFFHPYSPGSAFYQPNGTLIFRRLNDLIRREYRKRGYQEVMTPQLFNQELWEKSGHLQKYRPNMFELNYLKEEKDKSDQDKVLKDSSVSEKSEGVRYSIKPMNCPSHCLMFQERSRSYRELPLRIADFGCLHRNELSGSLRGLTRVRKFQQDDAHIFCTPDQIKPELIQFLKFLHEVYSRFGFDYTLELSTRPEQFLGDIELWNKAENIFKEVLKDQQHEYTISEGDGAFYGPKIDVHLTDSAGRQHQCGTVQLDFVLPERFDLEYASEVSGELKRPVMIHRAIYGSFERFFAILCEHYQGKWPFWLSPHQIMLIPLSQDQVPYMELIQTALLEETNYQVSTNLRIEQDLRSRIKEAEKDQYHYIVVLGKKEQEQVKVCVRVKGKMKTVMLEDFVEMMNNDK